jgi:hypothetical protein
MPDFLSNQKLLNSARAAYEQAQLVSLAATANAQQAQAALDLASRQTPKDGHDNSAKIAQLTAAKEKAIADKAAARTSQQLSRAALEDLSGRFAVFSDPRQNVERLSDSAPFLLFPVRIETRFRTVSAGNFREVNAPTKHQLWVRIYPDDCSIDTFEPMMSQSELTNVKNYWMNMWRAGNVEDGERGAWRNLVSAHGSGRAGWLVDNFQPTNLAALPHKTDATDEILVIPTATALSAAEATATSSYWQSIWLADGDAVKQKAANTALEAAVGAARAADLIANYAPFNLADKPAPPLKKPALRLSTAFVIFPPDPSTTLESWTQAPQVRQFPDRFVVLGFSNGSQTLEAIGNPVTLPLYTGPDPTADLKLDPSSGIHPDGPDLFVPDELKWMVDFDAALAAGMALAIDITPEQAAGGFDRLLVIGLQLSTPAEQGAAALQELLVHHQTGRSGFSLIAQGAHAHNSTGTDADATLTSDANGSFDDRKNLPLFKPVADPMLKQDGQWLSEFLGIDSTFLATVHNSGGLDQAQARAMQTALWPATLGYWMNTLFTPTGAKSSIFSDDTIEQTRAFFTHYVSGRGALPAIRIGGQPYGILPTTAFSRIQWFQQDFNIRGRNISQNFLAQLHSILGEFDQDWATMSQSAAWVGRAGDPHQTLLDVLALHPSSVEYFSRTAEGIDALYNTIAMLGFGSGWITALINLGLQGAAVALLARFGYTGAALPDLLNHFFLKANPQVTNVIDDVPLSETSQIRVYTTDGKNYLQWLNETAAASLEALRIEAGFVANKTPQSLLYLYLRQALMLGYYESSYNYHRNSGVFAGDALLAMRTEPQFIHVAETAGNSESRFAALYKTESRITGSASLLVSDYIRQQIGISLETSGLTDQLNALKLLQVASTAELERLFAEHIDTVSYRYDAWLLALVSQRVSQLRAASANANNGNVFTGLYLGAYAWVENLKPSTDVLTTAQIPASISVQFPGTSRLMVDDKNGGYIHAPSMQHAGAAAVLRAGYLANATSANPDTMAINLSSARVRKALSVIEGIRNGQSLGALLGYQFERGLHDDHNLAEVDQFIYPLRKAFPLVADAMSSTKTDPNVSIEAIEARNVLDGRKLMNQVRTSGKKAYPYGLSTLPAVSLPKAQTALDDETLALLDTYDAVADLALAEGVYQAVQGNYDRVASTIEAYTTGNFPPEPGVVQTPPSGIGLTHRFAVQFKRGLAAPAGATPRAVAEPAVDDWLGTMLPAPNSISCTVQWNDPLSGAPQAHSVSLADLDLRPLDVLFLLKPDNVQAMAELDDRITRFALSTWKPRPDATLVIQYLTAPGKISMFEAGSLLRHLRTLITQSRPLRASDVLRSNDARNDDNATVSVDRARIDAPFALLQALATDMGNFLTPLGNLLTDTVLNRAAIIANVDKTLADAAALLERAARLNLPSSGWGFAYAWLHSAFTDLLAEVNDLVTRWKQKLSAYDAAIIAYGALPAGTSDADRFAALQAAELLIASKLDPLPATPALLLAALNPKRGAFQTRLTQFSNVLISPGTAFVPLFNSVTALSTIDFDSQPFDVTSFGDRAVTVSQDIARAMTAQVAVITSKIASVTAQLKIYDDSTSSIDQVQALQTAAKAIFGDDFQIVPEFTVTAAQAGEWANAVNASTSGDLFTYLKGTMKIDFPIDEWMYGVARVRPPLQSWESAEMLATAFGIKTPDITPIQFPFASGAPWLAMDYPPDYTIDSDRLLYTCLYSQPFNSAAPQCGLLLDEWTEVIPATSHDTGLTFNYNRPDNEPPQSMLLVTAASNTGTWQWQDIVTALLETLDLAKKRAVEPALLDPTVYSRFLPATVMANTSYGITIASSITAANGVIDIIAGEKHA